MAQEISVKTLSALKAKSKNHWYHEDANKVVGALTTQYPDALGMLNVLEMRVVLAGDATIGEGFNLILKDKSKWHV